jgi:hypothetical protein
VAATHPSAQADVPLLATGRNGIRQQAFSAQDWIFDERYRRMRDVPARHRAPINCEVVAEGFLGVVLWASWIAGFAPAERGGWLGIPWLVAAIGLVILGAIRWLRRRVSNDDQPRVPR